MILNDEQRAAIESMVWKDAWRLKDEHGRYPLEDLSETGLMRVYILDAA